MKNTLFRINELSKKEKATGLTVDEKQEQQMLRQNYTQTFRGSLDSILLNTKIVDQNGLNVTPAALQDAQIRLKLSKWVPRKRISIKHKKSWISYIEIPALFIVFSNLAYERYIAIHHDILIANASKKNILLNCAKSIDWFKYDFNATRTTNSPTKVNITLYVPNKKPFYNY